MALREEVGEIQNKADRIARLIAARQMTNLYANDNEDAVIEITQAMKQVWNDKITALKADIKAITDTW